MEFNSILNGKEQTGADRNDIIHLERIKKLKLSLTLWDVRLPILSPSFVPSTTSTVPTTVTQFQAMVRKTMVRKQLNKELNKVWSTQQRAGYGKPRVSHTQHTAEYVKGMANPRYHTQHSRHTQQSMEN